MKAGIHPEYTETTVVCSCGNTFVTRSTAGESLHVELCNECHPFYTGQQKLVDSGGRVERFQRRYGRTSFTRAGADSAPTDSTETTAASARGPSEDPPNEEAPEADS